MKRKSDVRHEKLHFYVFHIKMGCPNMYTLIKVGVFYFQNGYSILQVILFILL